MEERKQEQGQLPGEVVEIYRQPERREVVERYVRPLPDAMRPRTEPAPPAVRRSRRGLWIFLISFGAVLLLAAGAWLLNSLAAGDEETWPGGEERGEKQEITVSRYPTGQGAELTVERDHGPVLTAQEVYRLVNPAVVGVVARLDESEASVGTGVIFRPDGYILTNYHVLEGGWQCSVILANGYEYDAAYVAGDRDSDLAVLKVELTGLPAAVFGDSDRLAVGEPVYAIGNPLGMELRGTLTDGIVSAIDRDVEVDGRTMTLIQTNAALNSGNSGGPLINAYGQVVGINTVKMISAYSNVEGLGFAIPSASIQRLANDLLTFGRVVPEPVLGVSVLLQSVEMAPGVRGLEVVEVTPASPADLAGIRVGDCLLTAGGEPLSTSQDLLRVRRRCYPGDQLPVTLWRGGETLSVTLVFPEE